MRGDRKICPVELSVPVETYQRSTSGMDLRPATFAVILYSCSDRRHHAGNLLAGWRFSAKCGVVVRREVMKQVNPLAFQAARVDR